MTTMIFVFLTSLALALILTPLVRKRSTELGILDQPGHRRVHSKPIARAGGVAVFIAFLVPFVGAIGAQQAIGITNAEFDAKIICFLAGAGLCFAVGLWDDISGLSPRTKASIQAIAAGIAYLGGVKITQIAIPGFGLTQLGILSAPVTIFWFLLLINAINLIDGLDGLAAGIIFFASIILLGVHSPASSFSVAIGFAALAGSTLGFLRYNFNPASIFLGDSGAYFLGFTFAGLSTLGALKTPAAVGLLIPLIAAGVPLFDVLWSPIRRFILGRQLFGADKDHIHHRLLSMGYTQRRAVLTLYASTVFLGVVGLTMIHGQNERAALGLVVAGAAVLFAVRKLGYLDFVQGKEVRRWMGNVSDQIGLAHERRQFLAKEIAIHQSATEDELLDSVREACREIGLSSLHIQMRVPEFRNPEVEISHGDGAETRVHRKSEVVLSMPMDSEEPLFGTISATLPASDHAKSPFMLNRVDQIRRATLRAIKRLRNETRQDSQMGRATRATTAAKPSSAAA